MRNVPPVIEYLPLLLPLINIAVCIPLLLRKVPPNAIYGFRTPKTLSDPQIWYEANYRGAVDLTVASVIGLLVWVFVAASTDTVRAALVGVLVTVTASLVALVVWLVQLRKM